jgi:ATP-binding cassette subfamily F protein 3
MIQVDDLSIAYGGQVLFSEASFSIQPGEHCALVGRNGSGKTTIFRLLAGKETSDTGTISIKKGYTLGVLEQHIVFKEATILEEAALALPKGEEDSLHLAEKVLFGLGFSEEQMYISPQELSGGYQLRLNLAKVLISQPDCLLLDEPTNYLDIVSIAWFTRFLQQWRGEFVLISHDREFVDAVSTHTMGIHRNRVRKIKGNTVDFYEKIVLDEEVHARTAQNLEKKRAHLQSFVDRFGAKASKAAQAQGRLKMIQRIPVLERLKELYHLDFQFNEINYSAKSMLNAANLRFGYDPNLTIIEDFSLDVEKGERIAIIGKNGRGKSTLLRLIANDLTPQEGSIRIRENVQFGYFGQTNIQRLHPDHTVEQEISVSNPKLTYTEVKGICGLMMFSGDSASKKTSMLSGGEKSRVLLGKILAAPCNMLLFDEPTHHLDMESIEALIDAIEDFSGAVIIVTHSELILRRLQLDKIVICHEGSQQLFLGTYDDFLEKGGWGSSNESKAPKKSGKQRESKQQRAESVVERAKALKPIEQNIVRIEKEIAKAESDLQIIQDKLVDLTQKGIGGSEIQEKIIAQAKSEKLIKELYTQWEQVMAEKEAINRE